MSKSVVEKHFTLPELMEIDKLSNMVDSIFSVLDKKNIAQIINAFYFTSLVTEEGKIYVQIKNISKILRTGNSKAERPLIYRGKKDFLSPAQIITYEGHEYISGPSLAALLDYRISTSKGKTKVYLKLSKNIFNNLNDCTSVNDLREMFLHNVEENRKNLKKERIKLKGITKCELSGREFDSENDVEFSHIDSVAVAPEKALNVENGLIVLKTIHKDITKNGINDFKELYVYCINNDYSTDWAE
jgi:hypothetical protein